MTTEHPCTCHSVPRHGISSNKNTETFFESPCVVIFIIKQTVI